MNKEINLQISEEIKQKPDQLDVLIHHIHIARHLERIADHTTNIAEDIIYLTKGDIIRHHKPDKKS
jgi:phosphate transport system protein